MYATSLVVSSIHFLQTTPSLYKRRSNWLQYDRMGIQVNRGEYRGVHGNTWEYIGIQGNTGHYRGVHGNTGEYNGMQGNTGEYRGVQGSTGEYMGIETFSSRFLVFTANLQLQFEVRCLTLEVTHDLTI